MDQVEELKQSWEWVKLCSFFFESVSRFPSSEEVGVLIKVNTVNIPRVLFTMGKEVEPTGPWQESRRLSPFIKPMKYRLRIQPDLKTGIFTGSVSISVDMSVSQSYIAVHAKGLKITDTTLYVYRAAAPPIPLRDCFEYVENEFWICQPMEMLEPKKYKLYFEFEGKLTDKIVGFYRSTYLNMNGEESHIATTKFEPTFARQAFPCFDEPEFKATFVIQVVKPSTPGFTALSNMPKESEKANQPAVGLTTVKFQSTFPMSTYLACFIVCDFQSLPTVQTSYGLPVTVYARAENIGDLVFARDFATVAAEYFSNFFNFACPLPKLDLIAIPDFVSGAMENWGLITFRETRLVCDEDNSACSTQLDVALTVAHEVAHMWFGDLVTMNWWNDLWLNEGFATFLEYKAVCSKLPLLDANFAFLENEVFSVMNVDATLNSHPIIADVDDPDQITEIFDSISYNKGASIIRMLEVTVGMIQFRSGIRKYIADFCLKNAETEDLWKCIAEHAADELDIAGFMNTWTRQMGFPVLNVKVDKCTNKMIITQKRFLSDPTAISDESTSPYRYKWKVPVTYSTSVNPIQDISVWFEVNDEMISIDLPVNASWVKVNSQHTGYYLVNYEDWMWEKFHSVLINNSISLRPSDRGSLLYSAFRLAEASQLSYSIALLMIEYLNRENHFFPWRVASKELHILNQKFYGTDDHNVFKRYVRSLVQEPSAFTWDIPPHGNYASKSLHSTLLELGCAAGNETCLHKCVRLFEDWLDEPDKTLNPELASMIMCYGIAQTSNFQWNKLWVKYKRETDVQFKAKMMRALCSTKEPSLISRLLEYGKNEFNIRSQDYLSVIGTCALNPTASPIVWSFYRKEWTYLVDRYTLNDRYLGNLIRQVAYLFSTEARLSEMNEFFSKYPEAGAGTIARKQALEKVKNNMLWRVSHFQTVNNWFKQAVSKLPEEEDESVPVD